MNENLKLYQCNIMEDSETETILVVAKDEEDAQGQISEMNWDCFMGAFIREVVNVNGYKIIVEKVRE